MNSNEEDDDNSEEKYYEEQTKEMLEGWKGGGGPLLEQEGNDSRNNLTVHDKPGEKKSLPKSEQKKRAAPTQPSEGTTPKKAKQESEDDMIAVQNVPDKFLTNARTIENWKAFCRASRTLALTWSEGKNLDQPSAKRKLNRMYDLLSTVPHLKDIIGEELMDEFKKAQPGQNDTLKEFSHRKEVLSFIRSVDVIGTIPLKLTEVYNNLLALARLSQADGSVRQGKSTRGGVTTLDEIDRDAAQFIVKKGLLTSNQTRPFQCLTLDKLGGRDILSLDELGKYKSSVEQFNGTYQCMLSTFIACQKEKKEKEKLIEQNEEQADDDEKEEKEERRQKEREKQARQRFLKEMETHLTNPENPENDPKKFFPCFPLPISDEKNEAQPFLMSVVRSLGILLDNVHDDRTSGTSTNDVDAANNVSNGTRDTPPKTKACKDRKRRRNIAKGEKQREADGSVAVDGRYMYLLRDDAVEIPIEIKVDLRPSIPDTLELVNGGSDQIYAVEACNVGLCFNFAGGGVNGKSTGIVLLPSCIKIIQLCLENMGTKDVRLVGYETSVLPLMTVENFNAYIELVEGDKMKQRLESLKPYLYPKEEDQENHQPSTSEQSIPTGIIALAALLTSHRADLFGPDEIPSAEIGPLIGHGSFCAVYEHKTKSDAVIKLSRYGEESEIEREATVLKNLQHPSIVNLYQDGKDNTKFSFDLGGVNAEVPAIVLEPRGWPIWSKLDVDEELRKQQVLKYGEVLKDAVEHIHQKGYIHGDITPDNILYSRTRNGPVLADFGLTVTTETKLKGFKGTPLYAHAEIFLKHPSKPWKPKKEYDFASLSFAMAAMSSFQRRPWPAVQPCNVDKKDHEADFTRLKDWIENRSGEAKKWLDNAGFSDPWLNWCNDMQVFQEGEKRVDNSNSSSDAPA